MFFKFIFLISCLPYLIANTTNNEWDLAVVIKDQIEFIYSNGTIAGTTYQQIPFSNLRALAFDSIRHQFVVSDFNKQNDTIFTVPLTEKTDIQPIMEDLPDEVQGLAIDPIHDILYWTDSLNKTINYVSLNDSSLKSKVLIKFVDEKPQDITIDVCRGYIYWTNSNILKPTIERIKIGTTTREVLFDSDLYRPSGITIDYRSQRLLWADQKEGIYYTIESSDLNGKEREILYEGSYNKPFGMAVNFDTIFWTDIDNKALWSMPIGSNRSHPEKLHAFKEQPLGIVARNAKIRTSPDCDEMNEASDSYNRMHNAASEKIKKRMGLMVDGVKGCLNGGELIDDDYCRCPNGYAGDSCELSLCYNYCLHGSCRLTQGYRECHCWNGYTGDRCEKSVCDGHCLNKGDCTVVKGIGRIQAECRCVEGFSGSRCEMGGDYCDLACNGEVLESRTLDNGNQLCRCLGGAESEVVYNLTRSQLLAQKSENSLFIDHFQDPAFLIMSAFMFLSIVVIIILSVYICTKRGRPRIKKRIIVNKNVTPLTYRPQPTTEQCEITIENCCNMNVCETPCFEPPPQLPCRQGKSDDKKKLLSNMENGEDLY